MSATRPKTKAHNLTELDSLFHKTRRAFLYALLFSFCMNVLMLLLPIYSLQVLDRVISSHSMDTLILLTLITVIGFAFYAALSLIKSYVLEGTTQWLDHKLAPKLLAFAVMKSSFGGGVATAGQYQRDLANIKAFIMNGLSVLLDAPWSLIFIVVIYMINPILGFISVLGIVILVGLAVINELATKKPLEQSQEGAIQSSQLADIASRNAEAIEAMGMLDPIVHNWTEFNKPVNELQHVASSRNNIIQAISRFLRIGLQIAVTGVGAYLALKGELTPGGLIASSILVGRALAPFEGAISIWKLLVTARESYHRLDAVLESVPNLRGSMALPRPKGRLTAESVYYSPPNTPPILKNINFVLEPGEGLGIIGPSAAGKSTLAKLIIGLVPPTHGSIRLDAAETFKWNRNDFGKHVGYMPQQVDLFNGTIKDNIARMVLDATDEEVIAAAQFAGCHEMILRLPNGYETQFHQGNLSLSPGQRQRIGLARAVFRRPQFVVMDEPNGNLDGDGERALLTALARMKQAGMTFIVVAHRPSIVGSVDKIMMLRHGAVEAFGPREDVLKQYAPQNVAKPAQQAAPNAPTQQGQPQGGAA